MKLVATIAVLLAGAVAFAYPAVHDKSVFVGNHTDNKNTQTDFTLSFELVAFDEASMMFTLNSTTTVGSQSEVEVSLVAETDFLHNELVKYLLENCQAQGGQLETVTVPAGSFPTCAMPTENGGTTWIGDVPFGIVKVRDLQNGVTELSLQSFVNGQ